MNIYILILSLFSCANQQLHPNNKGIFGTMGRVAKNGAERAIINSVNYLEDRFDIGRALNNKLKQVALIDLGAKPEYAQHLDDQYTVVIVNSGRYTTHDVRNLETNDLTTTAHNDFDFPSRNLLLLKWNPNAYSYSFVNNVDLTNYGSLRDYQIADTYEPVQVVPVMEPQTVSEINKNSSTVASFGIYNKVIQGAHFSREEMISELQKYFLNKYAELEIRIDPNDPNQYTKLTEGNIAQLIPIKISIEPITTNDTNTEGANVSAPSTNDANIHPLQKEEMVHIIIDDQIVEQKIAEKDLNENIKLKEFLDIKFPNIYKKATLNIEYDAEDANKMIITFILNDKTLRKTRTKFKEEDILSRLKGEDNNWNIIFQPINNKSEVKRIKQDIRFIEQEPLIEIEDGHIYIQGEINGIANNCDELIANNPENKAELEKHIFEIFKDFLPKYVDVEIIGDCIYIVIGIEDVSNTVFALNDRLKHSRGTVLIENQLCKKNKGWKDWFKSFLVNDPDIQMSVATNDNDWYEGVFVSQRVFVDVKLFEKTARKPDKLKSKMSTIKESEEDSILDEDENEDFEPEEIDEIVENKPLATFDLGEKIYEVYIRPDIDPNTIKVYQDRIRGEHFIKTMVRK